MNTPTATEYEELVGIIQDALFAGRTPIAVRLLAEECWPAATVVQAMAEAARLCGWCPRCYEHDRDLLLSCDGNVTCVTCGESYTA